MKRIITSLATIALVVGVVVAVTGAYFSDTETSTGNTFAAGTLNLNLTDDSDNGTESETATWVASKIAPGNSGGGERLTLQNTGSLDGYIDLSGITVSNTEGVNPESETGEPGELGDNLKVQIWLDADNDGVVDVDTTTGKLLETSIYPAAAIGEVNPGVTGVLNSFTGSYDLDELLSAGANKYIGLLWSLPDTTGNDVQSDIATLSFTVELDQVAD